MKQHEETTEHVEVGEKPARRWLLPRFLTGALIAMLVLELLFRWVEPQLDAVQPVLATPTMQLAADRLHNAVCQGGRFDAVVVGSSAGASFVDPKSLADGGLTWSTINASAQSMDLSTESGFVKDVVLTQSDPSIIVYPAPLQDILHPISGQTGTWAKHDTGWLSGVQSFLRNHLVLARHIDELQNPWEFKDKIGRRVSQDEPVPGNFESQYDYYKNAMTDDGFWPLNEKPLKEPNTPWPVEQTLSVTDSNLESLGNLENVVKDSGKQLVVVQEPVSDWEAVKNFGSLENYHRESTKLKDYLKSQGVAYVDGSDWAYRNQEMTSSNHTTAKGARDFSTWLGKQLMQMPGLHATAGPNRCPEPVAPPRA